MPGATERIVALHAAAPDKPAFGQPCNGCGVCCAATPCPLGRVVHWQWRGRCPSLDWSVADRRYRCRLLAARDGRPAWLERWLRRAIAAGQGCDFDASVETVQ
jgi:hypothetical protein